MRKLLIIDDEYGVRILVRMTLDDGQYDIIEAQDGASALELARSELPDLILLDVTLPDMSGAEVCRRLKAAPPTAGIAVVMLTAKARRADIGEAEDAGADGCFTKPFSPMALLQRVDSILGGLQCSTADVS